MSASPGLNPRRLVQLMREAIERCQLDLREATVLTEAATGAYVVTPVLAAMAGARRVIAVTRASRYGSIEQVQRETLALADAAGIAKAVEFVTQPLPSEADVITNSGHLRPIDAAMIAAMKATAVVPLMYESWEFRDGDVDLRACSQRGIGVAGTNERHPAIDVFSFLGVMAVKQLFDAGVAVLGSRILLLCDNDFAPFIESGLTSAGAVVTRSEKPVGSNWHAIVVAMTPRGKMKLDVSNSPGAVVCQYWGDIDRAGLDVWPPEEPPLGHMGVLPSAIGPEPVVRLQSGGLKVGEVMWRARMAGLDATRAAVDSGYGQALERD